MRIQYCFIELFNRYRSTSNATEAKKIFVFKCCLKMTTIAKTFKVVLQQTPSLFMLFSNISCQKSPVLYYQFWQKGAANGFCLVFMHEMNENWIESNRLAFQCVLIISNYKQKINKINHIKSSRQWRFKAMFKFILPCGRGYDCWKRCSELDKLQRFAKHTGLKSNVAEELL